MKPVHPILVHFPIALLPLSVAADLIGFFADVLPLSHTGWWALLGAAAGGVAAVAAGFFDMSRADLSAEVHTRVHRHMYVGLVLLTVIVGLAIWRGFLYFNNLIVPMLYLDLGVLGVALVGLQGWLGGKLVYDDGVFVRQQDGKAAPAQRAAAEDGTPAGKAKAGGHQGH